ncbi:hypothetical protein EQ500_15220, partial [Lactobacillus sp. XV13L]|nr:hypothetical protein [Lactobacillus sp. XV13L]
MTIDFKSLMGVKLVDENGNPVKASDPVIYNYTQALKDGKVKVILNGKEITLQDGVANFDAANGKYTYNRTISVTGTAISDKDKDKDKDIKVKDDPVTGVVTIKDNLNTSMAQLYDPKGRVIIDRALPMRSS